MLRRLVPLVCAGVALSPAACRNTIVDDVRADGGPDVEGEGEGEAGEGEGEDPCDVTPPAVSVRVADGAGFVYCEPETVRVTTGGVGSFAEVVAVPDDGCRHQGGFGVPGTYIVDVTVAGFAPEQVTVDVPANSCNDPVTTTLQVLVAP